MADTALPLIFKSHGVKQYAETPAGEIAFGDRQGLYEWRNRSRIHYTGGDQTHMKDGYWCWSGVGPVHLSTIGTHLDLDNPHGRGLLAAFNMKARSN